MNIKIITLTNDSRQRTARFKIPINSFINLIRLSPFFTYFINLKLLKHLKIQNALWNLVIRITQMLLSILNEVKIQRAEKPTSMNRLEMTKKKSNLFQLSQK